MKRILSMLLSAALLICLCACGESDASDPMSTDSSSAVSSSESDVDTGTDTGSDTETDTDKEASTSTKTEKEEKDLTRTPSAESNLVLATDQMRRRVAVYDLSACEGDDLDDCLVWIHTPNAGNVNIAGIKYREDTVFGDVILLIGGQFASIVAYPEGKVIWQTTAAGNNGHCIEILPNGNIVTAASTGNTLTMFNTSARVENPNATVTRKVYEFADAHGVLWDPEYKVLWALGLNELAAYNTVGEGADMELVRNQEMSAALPSKYGHAIGADFTDTKYLWLSTGASVYRFDKTTKVFDINYENRLALNHTNVKGFGNYPNGNACYTFPNKGVGRKWEKMSIAEWCTDTIYYFYQNEEGKLLLRPCVSGVSAFYKVVPFYGQYQ